MENLPESHLIRDVVGRERKAKAGAAVRYLRTLLPAWWVVCTTVLLVLAVLLLLWSTSAVLALPVFLAAAGVVLWAGLRSAQDRRLLWVSLPVSAFVVGGMLGLVAQLVQVVDDQGTYGDPYAAGYSDGSPELYYGNEPVENVYAFNSAGEPLTDIYLYDEQGRPLTLSRYGCDESSGSEKKLGEDNRFPRPHLKFGAYDDEGNYNAYNAYNAYRPTCREITEVPFSAAIPKEMASRTPPAK